MEHYPNDYPKNAIENSIENSIENAGQYAGEKAERILAGHDANHDLTMEKGAKAIDKTLIALCRQIGLREPDFSYSDGFVLTHCTGISPS